MGIENYDDIIYIFFYVDVERLHMENICLFQIHPLTFKV